MKGRRVEAHSHVTAGGAPEIGPELLAKQHCSIKTYLNRHCMFKHLNMDRAELLEFEHCRAMFTWTCIQSSGWGTAQLHAAPLSRLATLSRRVGSWGAHGSLWGRLSRHSPAKSQAPDPQHTKIYVCFDLQMNRLCTWSS